MPSTPPIQQLSAAYVDMLSVVTDRPWANLDAPGTFTTPTLKPYGLLQRIDGGESFGSVSKPASMATVIYQLTSVGIRADQAEALLDRAVEATMTQTSDGWANAITAIGLTVIGRRPDLIGGVQTEGELVNAVQRMALTVAVA
jgi:hypothetical protein